MAKVILTNEVSGLGSAGDVVEVKNGYARNYLLPQGFAVAWSRGGEKQVADIKQARAARELASVEDAQALKAGAEGRLFGSVKTGDIADAIAAAGVGSVDKRTIEIAGAIKSTGSFEATVKLHEGVVANIALKVVAAK
jgi:large subunit ribosomal protein L9